MSSVVFFCAICGSAISADSTADCLTECPACTHIVPVPAPLSATPELAEALGVFPRGVLALEVKFRCQGCSSKLQIDARLEGRTINCPKCKQAAKIPIWSRRPPATGRLSAAEIDFLSAPLDTAAWTDRGLTGANGQS